MTPHKSQNQRIIDLLERDGRVSRNQCLSMFPAITRLGARIDDLEKLGYEFRPERKGGDYVYRLIATPAARQMTLV
jgi:Helix-turn-helix domain